MRTSLAHLGARTIIATALATLSACGSYTGSWPRLGPTTQEARETMEQRVEPSASAQAQASTLDPADTQATRTIRTRLAQVTTAFAETKERASLQRKAVVSALDKAGSITGSSWSLAQLELSRLNQIDADLATLRVEAAGIAGDLAALSASGLPVGSLVSQTGTLINTISQEITSVEKTRDSARVTLAS